MHRTAFTAGMSNSNAEYGPNKGSMWPVALEFDMLALQLHFRFSLQGSGLLTYLGKNLRPLDPHSAKRSIPEGKNVVHMYPSVYPSQLFSPRALNTLRKVSLWNCWQVPELSKLGFVRCLWFTRSIQHNYSLSPSRRFPAVWRRLCWFHEAFACKIFFLIVIVCLLFPQLLSFHITDFKNIIKGGSGVSFLTSNPQNYT